MCEEGVALYLEYQEKHTKLCIGLDAHDGAKIFYRVIGKHGVAHATLGPKPSLAHSSQHNV